MESGGDRGTGIHPPIPNNAIWASRVLPFSNGASDFIAVKISFLVAKVELRAALTLS